MILYRLLERANFRGIARRLYRVTITGAERIPPAGAAILVANHESMFDPWLLALATPRPVRYMAKAELWRIPLVGRALDAFGTFPVERGTGDATAMSRAASLLHAGEVIGIFPQGTSKQLPTGPFTAAPLGWHSRRAPSSPSGSSARAAFCGRGAPDGGARRRADRRRAGEADRRSGARADGGSSRR